jgi:predicted DNA-binding transcriptional regulator AlpA
MERSVTHGDQIEALLRCLLETEGVEILVRKCTEGDHILPAKRRRVANTKNVAAPGMREAQEEQETGTASENEKGDAQRPMLSMKLKIVPVSRSTLARLIDAGNFPKSKPLSDGRAAWFEDDVKAWQKALDEGREPGGRGRNHGHPPYSFALGTVYPEVPRCETPKINR